MKTTQEAEQFLVVAHCTGLLLSFIEDSILKEFIFLDPNWLFDALAKIKANTMPTLKVFTLVEIDFFFWR
jgi:hypothetical protein